MTSKITQVIPLDKNRLKINGDNISTGYILLHNHDKQEYKLKLNNKVITLPKNIKHTYLLKYIGPKTVSDWYSPQLETVSVTITNIIIDTDQLIISGIGFDCSADPKIYFMNENLQVEEVQIKMCTNLLYTNKPGLSGDLLVKYISTKGESQWTSGLYSNTVIPIPPSQLTYNGNKKILKASSDPTVYEFILLLTYPEASSPDNNQTITIVEGGYPATDFAYFKFIDKNGNTEIPEVLKRIELSCYNSCESGTFVLKRPTTIFGELKFKYIDPSYTYETDYIGTYINNNDQLMLSKPSSFQFPYSSNKQLTSSTSTPYNFNLAFNYPTSSLDGSTCITIVESGYIPISTSSYFKFIDTKGNTENVGIIITYSNNCDPKCFSATFLVNKPVTLFGNLKFKYIDSEKTYEAHYMGQYYNANNSTLSTTKQNNV